MSRSTEIRLYPITEEHGSVEQQQRWNANAETIRRYAATLFRRNQFGGEQHCSCEDLIQEGWSGWVECQQRFRVNTESDQPIDLQFSRYASSRVWGAMMDAVRSSMPLSRGTMDIVRHCQHLYREQTGHVLHECVDPEEFFHITNIRLSVYSQLLQLADRGFVSLDARKADYTGEGFSVLDGLSSTAPSPEEQVSQYQEQARMVRIVAGLPLPCNVILFARFWLNMSEITIARRLGVTDSAVAHRLRQALTLCHQRIILLQNRVYADLWFGVRRQAKPHSPWLSSTRQQRYEQFREYVYDVLAQQGIQVRE